MKNFFAFILCTTTLAGFVGCSDDEDKTFDQTSLVGTWYCTYQKWVEDGESWDATYNADGSYYICFDDDSTGYLDSGDDQLLELGGYYSFTYSISGNRIIVMLNNSSREFEDDWTIKSLSDTALELYWADKDYNITCKFVKKAN